VISLIYLAIQVQQAEQNQKKLKFNKVVRLGW
jgi:hypothetical protein